MQCHNNKSPRDSSTTQKSFYCTQEKPKFTLKHLWEEINTLADDKKEDAELDLLGMERSDTIDETKEFLSRKIDALLEELDSIDEKEAFELAMFMNPDYAVSKSFMTKFLRADRYDIHKTAKRIVKYWDRKVQLFGTEASFRPLELHDLKHEDMAAILLGGIRRLPDDDLSGRPIIMSYRKFWDNRPSHMESNLRLLWYVVHDSVEEELAQTSGLVWLMKNDMPMGSVSMIPVEHLLDVRDALPIRCAGIHWFLPNYWVQYMFEHMLAFTSPEIRARVRIYTGNDSKTHMEELEEYGIPRESLPAEFGGTLVFNYLEWITFLLEDDSGTYSGVQDMDEESSDED